MEELQQALLRRKQIEGQVENLSTMQAKGDIGGAIASIGLRRANRRLSEQDEKISNLSEQRRQALISTLDPQQQKQAQQLDTSTIESVLADRLTTSSQAKPLSTEGKLQEDIRQGFVDPSTRQERNIKIPEELQTGENYGERAVAIEQIANQNAALGNNQLGS